VGDVTAAAVAAVKTPAEIRRARYLGITYLLLAVLVLWLFALGSMDYDHATWGLARANDPVLWGGVEEISFSASGLSFVVAGLMAMAGGVQLWRGFGKWSSVVLAVALVLFILAFLAWATARSSQGSFSMVGMLQATVLRSVPITFGALSGVLCERVAVINIAIEGMLLGGAFVAVVVGSSIKVAEDYLILGAPIGSWIGVGVAMLSGAVLSWALAVLAIRYRVDQIIVGVVINIFVLGLTSFLSLRILVENPDFNKAAIFKALQIPGLSRIPLIGPILFAHNIFVYAMFLLVAVLTFGLFRTRWGLRARAVGEHPKAADTLGINVYRMRYLNVLLGGLVAGFGGAYFTVGSVGRFDENMTNGRGFIGLAAMIFGRWHPVGAMAAGLVFGFADALSQKLGILQTPIPSEFLGMAPFLATILVVAGLVGKARPPAADGQPYIKE
jgi:simple sugar transport system permease protein